MGYGVIPIPAEGGEQVIVAVLAAAGARVAEVEMQSLPTRHLRVPDDIYQSYLSSQLVSGQNTGGDGQGRAKPRARKATRRAPEPTAPATSEEGTT